MARSYFLSLINNHLSTFTHYHIQIDYFQSAQLSRVLSGLATYEFTISKGVTQRRRIWLDCCNSFETIPSLLDLSSDVKIIQI